MLPLSSSSNTGSASASSPPKISHGVGSALALHQGSPVACCEQRVPQRRLCQTFSFYERPCVRCGFERCNGDPTRSHFETAQAEVIQKARGRAVKERTPGQLAAPDNADQMQPISAFRHGQPTRRRIASISDLATGCRYAMIASVSQRRTRQRVGRSCFSKLRTQRPASRLRLIAEPAADLRYFNAQFQTHS